MDVWSIVGKRDENEKESDVCVVYMPENLMTFTLNHLPEASSKVTYRQFRKQLSDIVNSE